MSFGHVKFFNAEQRWGIIIPEGVKPHERQKHVFFYEDVLQREVKRIAAGAEVEYEEIPNYPPGKRALSVKLIGHSYAAD